MFLEFLFSDPPWVGAIFLLLPLSPLDLEILCLAQPYPKARSSLDAQCCYFTINKMTCQLDLVMKIKSVLASALALILSSSVAPSTDWQHCFLPLFLGWGERNVVGRSGHSIPLFRGPGKLYSPVSITAGSENGRPVVSGPHLSSFSTWSIKQKNKKSYRVFD